MMVGPKLKSLTIKMKLKKSFMTENGPHFQIYTISNNLYNFLFVIQLLQDLFYQLARQYLFIFSVVSVTIFFSLQYIMNTGA